jgi:hypothetical protein
MMELSKADKKVARAIIDLGLQRERFDGLNEIDSVLQNWKNKKLDDESAYHLLYKTVIELDKHIARRYDAISGSRYVLVIVSQFRDGVITEEDLSEFSEDTRQSILAICKL